jgi:hypothetical protein
MKFSAYDELKMLLQDYTPQEVYDAAKKLVNFEAAKLEQIDMVKFAGRLCMRDMDKSMIGGEPLMRRYGK